MDRFIQVVQAVARKTCCPLFDCPPCEKLTWSPTKSHHSVEGETSRVVLRGPPSTVFIVNITNSTLIDCVIGKENYPSVVSERQPFMQEHHYPQIPIPSRCNCSCGQQGAAQTLLPPPPPSAEAQNITIHRSRLSCVIIGDNNCMQAKQSHYAETDDADECEAAASRV